MTDGGWKNADDKMRMEKCGWKNAGEMIRKQRKLKKSNNKIMMKGKFICVALSKRRQSI